MNIFFCHFNFSHNRRNGFWTGCFMARVSIGTSKCILVNSGLSKTHKMHKFQQQQQYKSKSLLIRILSRPFVFGNFQISAQRFSQTYKGKRDKYWWKSGQYYSNSIKLTQCLQIVLYAEDTDIGGGICTFSLLISLSFTFQSSKFNYSSSSKCCLTRTDNSNESVQLSFHYLKRDRTRRCFLFSVTCHIRIFWTDCEMIPELIICYWLLK